jgi:hypothetical protein
VGNEPCSVELAQPEGDTEVVGRADGRCVAVLAPHECVGEPRAVIGLDREPGQREVPGAGEPLEEDRPRLGICLEAFDARQLPDADERWLAEGAAVSSASLTP